MKLHQGLMYFKEVQALNIPSGQWGWDDILWIYNVWVRFQMHFQFKGEHAAELMKLNYLKKSFF